MSGDEFIPGVSPYRANPAFAGMLGGALGHHFGPHFGAEGIESDDCASRYGIGRLGVDGFPYNGRSYPFFRDTVAARFLEDIHISWQRSPLPEVHLKTAVGVGTLAYDGEFERGPHEIAFTFSDAQGEEVLRTHGMTHTSRVWCDNVKVHQWVSDEAVIQATVRHNGPLYDFYEFDQLALDPRALDFRPVHLRDVVVNYNGSNQSVIRENGNIRVATGYNVEFDTSSFRSDRGEKISQLKINASPGAGLGKFPGCDANVGITQLGGVSPTPEGDLLLSGTDCLSVRPAVNFTNVSALVLDGKFHVRDGCEAPCDCGDFASVANYAIGIWNQYRVLASRISDIRDDYHELRNQILNWKSCVERNPMRLHTWRAPPCGLGVGAGICNVSDECLTGLSLNFTLDDGEGESIGSINSDYVYQTRYASGLGYNTTTPYTADGNQINIPLDDIEPGQMGFIFFRFEFPEGSCDSAGNIQAEIQGTLPDSWSAVDPISKTFNFAS